jgi:ATP-binding cassette subfamily C (CFTR/MRP) protein 10
LAFLAGLAASVALIPLNKYIATKIGQLSNKMMQMKDERMKLGMGRPEEFCSIKAIH